MGERHRRVTVCIASGGGELRGLRVDDDVPAEQHVSLASPGPWSGLPLAGLWRSVGGERPGCPGPGRRLVQSLLTPSLPAVKEAAG
jgi:hypothetical protein